LSSSLDRLLAERKILKARTTRPMVSKELEAASRIDPRLGRPVTREEAHAHVRRAGEAGLVHVIGRNKLDAVWLDAWPGEKLLTVCNCCPCCCLWKMLPNLADGIGAKVTKMEGVELAVT